MIRICICWKLIYDANSYDTNLYIYHLYSLTISLKLILLVTCIKQYKLCRSVVWMSLTLDQQRDKALKTTCIEIRLKSVSTGQSVHTSSYLLSSIRALLYFNWPLHAMDTKQKASGVFEPTINWQYNNQVHFLCCICWMLFSNWYCTLRCPLNISF